MNTTRDQVGLLLERWQESRQLIQILHGPRQVGKTTCVLQALERAKLSHHFETADERQLHGSVWIEQQWQLARSQGRRVLVLDEVQKIEGWSETVKRLWDADTRAGSQMHVTLLGSSALLMEKGLSDSLAGRFELIPVTHWSFREMREAFSVSLDDYLFFGGYPGTAFLFPDFSRWKKMILDSLIETTVSRDILLHARIEKPALLKRLFELVCAYSSQILSYQKMVGQLQDVGNTTTLAHYLKLLAGAGLCVGLQKFEGKRFRLHGSIPKLQVMNNALMSAYGTRTPAQARAEPDYWGRLAESAVGAALVNWAREHGAEVFYWRDANREVDFVLQRGSDVAAFEVKSGRAGKAPPGMTAFLKKFHGSKSYLLGSGGMPFEEFFLSDIGSFLQSGG